MTRDTFFFLKLYKIKAKQQTELFGREGHTGKKKKKQKSGKVPNTLERSIIFF